MTADDAGPDAGPYPRLAAELRTLKGDALRLWGDAAEPRRAFDSIMAAWEVGSPDLAAAIARVNEAVLQGLAALGLPRGPSATCALRSLEEGGSGESGLIVIYFWMVT